MKKVILIASIVGIAIVLPFLLQTATTRANGDEPVTGYAWSSNVGWIDFQPSFGGVTYKTNSKQLQGYAWSDNIGWIYFGPTSGSRNNIGAPEAPDKWAELSGGTFVGWARAIANDASWDGWIKMSDSNYGVILNASTGIIDGYAWGGDVIGWISFDVANDPLSDGEPVGGGGGSGNCGDCTRITPQLGVSLSASPLSGSTPLASTLTATVTGDAEGNIDYTFDCDNDGTPEGTYQNKTNTTQQHVCTYTVPSSVFTASVNVTRQGLSAQDTVGITTTGVAPPTIDSFTASPSTVNEGGQSTLAWSSTNADSCSASDGWSGTKTADGNEVINNITSTTLFSLQCTGAGGSASSAVTVTVIPKDYTLTSSNDIILNILGDETQNEFTTSTTTIRVANPLGGFNSAVNLSATSNITGAVFNFSDPSLSFSEYSIGSIFSVTVPGDTPPGTYTATVRGDGGGVARTIQVQINSQTVDPVFREL